MNYRYDLLNTSSERGKVLSYLVQPERFGRPYESLDTTYEVCGGTREASAISKLVKAGRPGTAEWAGPSL